MHYAERCIMQCDSLGCLCVIYSVPQLELVGFAAVQSREPRQKVDELPAGGRGGSGGLQFIPAPDLRRPWRGHGVHY